MEKKTHEEIAIDLINRTLAECKKNNPSKYADAPEATKYNLGEIYDYLKG